MVRGEISPSLAMALYEGLPVGSATWAIERGGEEYWRQYLGASQEYYALAGMFNAINTNTAATGMYKKKPKFDPWPVPEVAVELAKKEKDKKPATVASLFEKMMNRYGSKG